MLGTTSTSAWRVRALGFGAGLVLFSIAIGDASAVEPVVGSFDPARVRAVTESQAVSPSGATRKTVRGPIGPRGPVGPRGATGPAGSQGVTGPAGPRGATGTAGPAGATGSTGPSGPSGIAGPRGPAGPAGITGPVGPTGPSGATGSRGTTGPAGPSGPSGATGPTGPSGVAGIQVLEGAPRTLAANGVDGVILQCPVGKAAISGGFYADDVGVVLSGSSPGGADPRVWIIEVTNLLGTATTWTPNLTCA